MKLSKLETIRKYTNITTIRYNYIEMSGIPEIFRKDYCATLSNYTHFYVSLRYGAFDNISLISKVPTGRTECASCTRPPGAPGPSRVCREAPRAQQRAPAHCLGMWAFHSGGEGVEPFLQLVLHVARRRLPLLVFGSQFRRSGFEPGPGPLR